MLYVTKLARRLSQAVMLPVALIFGIAGLMPTQTVALEKTQLGCLALNIYHEARGESRQGQTAIAAVTLNRVQSKKFPSTICGVVWQPRQFSWTHTQSNYYPTDMASWQAAMKIARNSLDKKVVADYENILFYHSKKVRPYWTKHKRFVARVGSHLFYSS
jgi:N-acetylmuramoyl-L-alanine amidase